MFRPGRITNPHTSGARTQLPDLVSRVKDLGKGGELPGSSHPFQRTLPPRTGVHAPLPSHPLQGTPPSGPGGLPLPSHAGRHQPSTPSEDERPTRPTPSRPVRDPCPTGPVALDASNLLRASPPPPLSLWETRPPWEWFHPWETRRAGRSKGNRWRSVEGRSYKEEGGLSGSGPRTSLDGRGVSYHR